MNKRVTKGKRKWKENQHSEKWNGPGWIPTTPFKTDFWLSAGYSSGAKTQIETHSVTGLNQGTEFGMTAAAGKWEGRSTKVEKQKF